MASRHASPSPDRYQNNNLDYAAAVATSSSGISTRSRTHAASTSSQFTPRTTNQFKNVSQLDSSSSPSSRQHSAGSVLQSTPPVNITSNDLQRPPSPNAASSSMNAPNHNNTSNSRRYQDESQQNQSTIYTPSKKHAIVLENAKQVSQDKCLRAVADIITGANIKYVTRLSGARVCMYLSNEECVERMCNEGGVVIDLEHFPVRRYVTEATKFVISNCPPEYTDDELKKLLEPYGRVVSAPSRLKVNTTYEDLKHVKTWRRSIYMMIPTDNPDPPKRVQITNISDGTKLTLYIERDELVCQHCLAPGHTIDKCKKKLIDDINYPVFQPPASTRIFNARKPSQTVNSVQSVAVNDKTNFMPVFSNTEKTSSLTSNITSTPMVSSIWSDLDQSFNNPLKSILDKTAPKQQQQMETLSSLNEKDSISQHSQETPSILDMSTEDQEEFQGFQDFQQPSPGLDALRVQIVDQEMLPSKNNSKRVHSPFSEEEQMFEQSISDTSSLSSSGDQPTKKKIKKAKEELAINQLLNGMKRKSSYLSDEDFRAFLSKCRGKANSRAVATSFTSNIAALIVQLNDAATICMDQNLKRRLSRAAEALVSHKNLNDPENQLT